MLKPWSVLSLAQMERKDVICDEKQTWLKLPPYVFWFFMKGSFRARESEKFGVFLKRLFRKQHQKNIPSSFPAHTTRFLPKLLLHVLHVMAESSPSSSPPGCWLIVYNVSKKQNIGTLLRWERIPSYHFVLLFSSTIFHFTAVLQMRHSIQRGRGLYSWRTGFQHIREPR